MNKYKYTDALLYYILGILVIVLMYVFVSGVNKSTVTTTIDSSENKTILVQEAKMLCASYHDSLINCNNISWSDYAASSYDKDTMINFIMYVAQTKAPLTFVSIAQYECTKNSYIADECGKIEKMPSINMTDSSIDAMKVRDDFIYLVAKGYK